MSEWDNIIDASPLFRIETFAHCLRRAVREVKTRPEYKTKAEDALVTLRNEINQAITEFRAKGIA